jgi:hypothetical protein
MAKLTQSADWHRLARTHFRLESLNIDTSPASLARYTGYKESEIRQTVADATYQEMLESLRRHQHGIWSEALAAAGVDIGSLFRPLGIKAILRLDDLIDSEDEKVALAAARLICDFNPDMERPVVRHEITNRFTNDELEQARSIVRKLKGQHERSHQLPGGEGPVN